MVDAQEYEQLGAFYLGREVDASGELSPTPLLYDAKDLTTHGVIVGMTGSGKTGLAVGLLEEAAIDGIPAIIIDPKGDMGNLALSFPKLRPEDFEPWIDPGEALRKGRTGAEHAAKTAALWRKGLGEWGQGQDRIARYKKSCQVRLWTPGSTAGHPLTVLRSFDAPPPAVLTDAESLADRIQATTAGLLGLIGIDADPVQSRETILVANILQHAWAAGQSLTVADVILAIQRPPFERLGVLALESFYPAKERMGLALRLNGLLASPAFAAWMEGEPLDVERLLYAPDGRPRLSVLCLSHLSDEERMSFVTVLLGEMLSWVRSQPGTSSLRALLYMDEIFGYFPPTANPPSKRPMLTLLKQARAFGLGVLLSTQNPVDLDYKGLSNCGTWFLGRLQTERDKMRVLDGLEGALSGGGHFDRSALERTLSGLGKRRFLLHNVHDSAPTLFQTRWVLNYLRGPLTRVEIERLTAGEKADPPTPKAAAAQGRVRREAAAEARVAEAAAALSPAAPTAAPSAMPRPVVHECASERFLPLVDEPGAGERVLYRPSLAAEVKLHYANRSAGYDEWRTLFALTPIEKQEPAVTWAEGEFTDKAPFARRGGRTPRKGASYAELPAGTSRKTTWSGWQRDLKQHVYRDLAVVLYRSREHRLYSEEGESEAAFRARVRQVEVEERDLLIEKLKAKYAKKLTAARERVRKAEERLGVQEEQLEEQSRGSWLRIGGSLLDALIGRRSLTTSRASTAARSRARVAREKQDVARAERELEQKRRELEELSREADQALAEVPTVPSPADLDIEELAIHPRKTDIDVSTLTVVWIPWLVAEDGTTRPASDLR